MAPESGEVVSVSQKDTLTESIGCGQASSTEGRPPLFNSVGRGSAENGAAAYVDCAHSMCQPAPPAFCSPSLGGSGPSTATLLM